MKRIIVVSLMLLNCGTQRDIRRSEGHYDSSTVPCKKHEINIIDGDNLEPKSVCLNGDETEDVILARLRRMGYLWDNTKYRIERDSQEVWIFRNYDPVMLLTTKSLATTE